MLNPTIAPTLADATTSLPEGGMVPLVIGVIAGLALWLAGVKIIRSVFVAMGAAIGGFTGAVLIPLTPLPPFELGPVTLNPGFTGLIVGGIIGALVAIPILRIWVAFTAAGAFAVAGAMAALVFLHVTDASDAAPADPSMQTEGLALNEETPPIIDFQDEARRLAAERLTDETQSFVDSVPEGTAASDLIDEFNTEETRETIRNAKDRSQEFLTDVFRKIQQDYESRPPRSKLILASSTFAGLGLGLLLGAVMPKRSNALVTSLFGSALWLATGNALIRANVDPDPEILNQPALVWAILWGTLTVIGMAVQFGLIKRRGGGSDDEADDDE